MIFELWEGKLPKGYQKSVPGHAESDGRNGNGKRSRIYQSWFNMLVRCYHPITSNPAVIGYINGNVMVCSRWITGEGQKSGFQCFMGDMGERPEERSLDRIDPTGNYTPDNCRWADAKTQANNKRKSRKRVV